MKRNVVDASIKWLQKNGMSRENIRVALEFCWNNGASTSLYLPKVAYDDLGSLGRETFAREVLRKTIIEQMKAGGEKMSKKEEARLIDWCYSTENTLPLMRLDTGCHSDWIVGEKTLN